MRKIQIGILRLTELFLPPHKRQQVRIAWLKGLVWPWRENEVAFYDWRNEMIIRATVTGEKGSLQWYLNHLYDRAQQRIVIIEAEETGIAVSLETENTAWVVAGLEASAETGVAFYLEGENTTTLPVDFRVLIPSGVSEDQVSGTVKLYNMAHRSFDIKPL